MFWHFSPSFLENTLSCSTKTPLVIDFRSLLSEKAPLALPIKPQLAFVHTQRVPGVFLLLNLSSSLHKSGGLLPWPCSSCGRVGEML